ncbi:MULTISPECIES: hypothetical protein [Streptomyces]|uniref:hypothetical protein n=1 Tax=Streptomyces TaxID=1883 RepID=UPI001072FBA1|nr:hypothetical protein [Streptomyces sp. 4R-3d]TFI19929.1 hypothetical protein E4P36_38180 [Streptomyces sp. 4R-3d]
MYPESCWEPVPARSTANLAVRFVLTVVVLPLHWAFVLVGTVALLAFSLVGDLLTLIPGAAKGFLNGIDRLGDRVELWPRWFVSWPELRHEGDADFYRARCDDAVTRHTRAATTVREGVVPPWTCAIPIRKYRAVGAGYALRTAEAQGWALRHDQWSDLPNELKLRRVPEEPAPDVAGA